MNTKWSIILLIFGAILVLDGLGSILVYPFQPLIFDHLVRLTRVVIGIIIMYVGLKVD